MGSAQFTVMGVPIYPGSLWAPISPEAQSTVSPSGQSTLRLLLSIGAAPSLTENSVALNLRSITQIHRLPSTFVAMGFKSYVRNA
jgi:hypothetical protein